jgi:archaemetzincin
VFGLASIRERTGVFSFARYDERFFELKKFEIDYNLIKFRSMWVMSHEITHMFGVRHCIFYKCLMNGSNHL